MATWSKDQWFAHQQGSEARDESNTEIGQVSHRLGEDRALEWLKGVLAETCPPVEWNTVQSRYQEIYEAGVDEVRAQMAKKLVEEEARAEDAKTSQVAEAFEANTENVPPSSQTSFFFLFAM